MRPTCRYLEYNVSEIRIEDLERTVSTFYNEKGGNNQLIITIDQMMGISKKFLI